MRPKVCAIWRKVCTFAPLLRKIDCLKLKRLKKMKKLAFVFATMVAVSFAACGNKTAENSENADSTLEAEIVEEVVEDSCCAKDSACCAKKAEAPAGE